jgi:hypothetical protein
MKTRRTGEPAEAEFAAAMNTRNSIHLNMSIRLRV